MRFQLFRIGDFLEFAWWIVWWHEERHTQATTWTTPTTHVVATVFVGPRFEYRCILLHEFCEELPTICRWIDDNIEINRFDSSIQMLIDLHSFDSFLLAIE